MSMMSSLQKARFALWNHSSQKVGKPLVWRETPRSKQLVGIVPSVVLPGLATVKRAGHKFIDVDLSEHQAQSISHWLSGLPEHVLPSAAVQDLTIAHSGSYCVYDRSFRSCSEIPAVDSHVRIKIHAFVSKIGPMLKANVIISDVLLS